MNIARWIVLETRKTRKSAEGRSFRRKGEKNARDTHENKNDYTVRVEVRALSDREAYVYACSVLCPRADIGRETVGSGVVGEQGGGGPLPRCFVI